MFFGQPKKKQPTPQLSDTISKLDDRTSALEYKISKLDSELNGIKQQLSKLPPGSPAKSNLMQRAKKILEQKKMYENQRNMMMNQSFNMEQANFSIQSVQDASLAVSAMKQASVSLKGSMRQMNVEKIDDMMANMDEMFGEANEINQMLGRNYNTEGIDDETLEAELNALGDLNELDSGSAVPSYLPEVPNSTSPVQETANEDLSIFRYTA